MVSKGKKKTVTFLFSGNEAVEVESYSQLNLLAHAQLAERSLQSRCGGQCECGTCRVMLVKGKLSAMSDSERQLLAKVAAGADGQTRLSCQSFPDSDEVVVEVPSAKYRDARTIK